MTSDPGQAPPRILPFGRRALLLELPGLAEAMAWHAELTARPLPGQREALAAARTVLVSFDVPQRAGDARELLASRRPGSAETTVSQHHRVPVVYNGADLAEVAALTGLSEAAVVGAHTGTPWRAAFGGFAPGFMYLIGGDPVLDVPRRATPRTAVPAGSVALAGAFSAVYPRESPGGWQLLGVTRETLWDARREPPALISPGDLVTFVPVHDDARLTSRAPLTGTLDVAAAGDGFAARGTSSSGTFLERKPAAASLQVVNPGMQTLFQDDGRPGHGNLGVTVSGAADRGSAHQANRLAGNPAGFTVLETLLGGLELRALDTVVLALAGATGESMILSPVRDPAKAPVRAPFALRREETLRLGAPASGLRGYVAVRGGFETPRELGSGSSDTLSGLGPAALLSGQELAVGHPAGAGVVGQEEPQATELGHRAATTVLRVLAGPRQDWSRAGELEARSWRVSAASNRVGLRLEPEGGQEPLERVRQEELPSEGMVPGSVQLPPSGLPVLFLADHPVTGGYPVIAVVVPEDLDKAAQLPPGTPVRFVAFHEAWEDQPSPGGVK